MTLVPRDYLLLLMGDLFMFAASLWVTLFIRYFEVPGFDLYLTHLVPFSILFVLWIFVFFVAGLYGRHTRLFRSRLPAVLLYAQAFNVTLAAFFFFLIPTFGLAPKTILVLYLAVSSTLIYLWRVLVFARLPTGRRLKGVLLASGPDAKMLADEVNNDRHYPISFEYVVDTSTVPSHEVIQRALRVAQQDSMTFLVVDFSDTAVAAALPIIYDTAFHKHRFALVEAADLYEEIFEKVPLSLVDYEWVLRSVGTSRLYDIMKRFLDIVCSLIIGTLSLIVYPFVMLAIKLEDGGPLFVTQHRVGHYQRPITIVKFRSMNGNDKGEYGIEGKTALSVTRVGRWLRMLRIDELPQIWNVLKGDLSLVGPRPELPNLAAQYSARIPYYNARYLVTPGLMGWAQLKHDRHPHHGLAIEETKEKLSYDLYYLKNRSLFLDIYVMLQTIRIILTARGS